MCNAWNHHPDCRCGWGGEGHLGRRDSNDGSVTKSVPPIYTKYYETFLNPNAKCPVCGQPVFYYQSPTGGRVFFDELGPPWPKHPCTIRKNDKIHFREMPTAKAVPTDYSWGLDGWAPFLGVNYERNTNSAKGHLNNRNIYLKIRFSKVEKVNIKALNSGLWMAKPLDRGNYSVSICLGNKTVKAIGFFQPLTHNSAQEQGKTPFLSRKLGNARFDVAGVEISCKECGRSKWISITTLLKEHHSTISLRTLSKNLKRMHCTQCKRHCKCGRQQAKVHFVSMNTMYDKFHKKR